MDTPQQLRVLLARQLDWQEAHVGFERALSDLPFESQGIVPQGFTHSCWQLLEHLRLAQADILDFCVNPGYIYPTSMAVYWPEETAPATPDSWQLAVASFERDIASLKSLALDDTIDLFDRVPRAESDHQTYARELILTTDHNAYHLGQLVTLRRLLGCWRDGPPPG